MELYMMRASIREEEDTTIARFLSGLSLEIKDRVELLPYQDLNDLVQLCIKVEQQNLRKTSSQRVGSYSNFYPMKDFKKEGSTSREKPKETTKPFAKETSTPPIRARDTKCFKCFGRGPSSTSHERQEPRQERLETSQERLEPRQERLGQWQEHIGPITRSMAKRLNEDLDQATD